MWLEVKPMNGNNGQSIIEREVSDACIGDWNICLSV